MTYVDPAKTWFIADLHLGHDNIRQYEPKRATRHEVPFEEYIAGEWDSQVRDDDTVWVLGDLIWRKKGFENWLHRRPGIKKVVLGNHDKRTVTWYKRWGFTEVHKLWTTLGVRRRWGAASVGDPTARFQVQPVRAKLLLSHYPISGGGPRYVDRQRACLAAFYDNYCDLSLHGHTHGHGLVTPWQREVSAEATKMGPMLLEDILREKGL